MTGITIYDVSAMLRVVSDFLGEQAKTDLLRSYGCSSLEELAVENYKSVPTKHRLGTHHHQSVPPVAES
jgi:hypothetical protein